MPRVTQAQTSRCGRWFLCCRDAKVLSLLMHKKGWDMTCKNDSGWYFEHTLGDDPGRADKNSGWREGANNLKGMGDIDATLNTGLAVGWQAAPWLSWKAKRRCR